MSWWFRGSFVSVAVVEGMLKSSCVSEMVPIYEPPFVVAPGALRGPFHSGCGMRPMILSLPHSHMPRRDGVRCIGCTGPPSSEASSSAIELAWDW